MTIKVYKDSSANAIFIEDSNGAQFLNSLHATVTDDTCSISDTAKSLDITTGIDFAEYVDESGTPYGTTAVETCDALNAIFSSSGTPTGNIPAITSTLSISSVSGSVVNYELTADYGVGYEWDLSNVPGITTVEGNPRKLIGGSGLPVGTYNIPVKAINYNGEDSKTIVLTVSTPPFANTKSVKFNNNDYLQANAGVLQNVLGRTTNGTGSSDAWTISFWFKPGTSTNQSQTIVYFGSQDVTNQGCIQIKYNGQNNQKRLEMRYGSSNNRLNFSTAINSLSTNNWYHIMVTYDGGTTGAGSGSVNAYYGRFNFFIDGTLVNGTNVNTNNNFGYTGSVQPQNFRVGRFNNGQTMRNNCKVDELAIWDSDQSANISDIYNSGSPRDLSLISSAPVHWWRMGDGDTYPFLFDSGSAANCTFQMLNMTSAVIVNDVP